MAWVTPYTSTVGMVLTAALKNQDRDNFIFLKGSRTSYTPQVDQGASTNIAKTITGAQYSQLGDWAAVNLNLSMTASGTAGSKVTVTLPSGLNPVSGVEAIGHGSIYNGTFYSGTWRYEASGKAYLSSDGQTNNWGVAPNVALANTNLIYLALFYPVV